MVPSLRHRRPTVPPVENTSGRDTPTMQASPPRPDFPPVPQTPSPPPSHREPSPHTPPNPDHSAEPSRARRGRGRGRGRGRRGQGTQRARQSRSISLPWADQSLATPEERNSEDEEQARTTQGSIAQGTTASQYRRRIEATQGHQPWQGTPRSAEGFVNEEPSHGYRTRKPTPSVRSVSLHWHQEPQLRTLAKHSRIVPGQVSSGVITAIPDAIRKKISNGWRSHVPLTYLTDNFCQNIPKHANLKDTYVIDPGTNALAPSSGSNLDSSSKDRLTFGEWHSAWRRLLDLIKEYFESNDSWLKHFSLIANADDAQSNWKTWLLYDIEVRKQSVNSTIDPGIFQVNIFNDCQTKAQENKIDAQLAAMVNNFQGPQMHSHATSSDSFLRYWRKSTAIGEAHIADLWQKRRCRC
ncbi:hypothetical protein FRC03_010769 [Tulasnella sp. 419]|nr:hypothetical protein FRC03_010769 [Tulasnella sp. 419]